MHRWLLLAAVTLLVLPVSSRTALGLDVRSVDPADPAATFQHGVAFPVWWHTLYATPEADQALAAAAATGINSVQLVMTWYQDAVTSTTIYPDPLRTPSDPSLAHAVATARRLRLQVMLKLHVDVQDGTWRGELAPSAVDAWFESYRRLLRRYARFARDHQVAALVIGTELRTLTTAPYTGMWREMIAEVRAAYPGQVAYAANWDEYALVGFWDALDFIGIDAYFPLVDAAVDPDPSFPEIVLAWQGYAGRHGGGAWLQDLDRFAAGSGKPIVFTEIGYRSQDGAADAPWLADNGRRSNADLQRRLYEAVYRLYVPRSYFRGLFWWRWDLAPETRAPHTITPRGKSAETVVRSWGLRLRIPPGASARPLPQPPGASAPAQPPQDEPGDNQHATDHRME